MNILWLSWKDIRHPAAGGAEIVMHELSKRMVADGHAVTILTAKYQHASKEDIIEGIKIIRVSSNRYVHSFAALAYYLRRLRNKYDIVIEAVNTAAYFGVLFKGKAQAVLLYHQLAREIWYHEAKAPLSHIGYYLLEPFATRVLARARATTLTISESTKADLTRYGFKPESTHIISEGLHITPLASLTKIKKYQDPTILSHGAMRSMKQTIDQIKAFEIAKQSIPALKMKLSGNSSGPYGQKVLSYITASPYKKDIQYLGRTTNEQKIELMQRCHAITVSSAKEGWGLIVTEANSQGTPAVVYDADGLRDSVRHEQTGIVTPTNPAALANGIVRLLSDHSLYKHLQQNAWEWSKHVTFDQSYKDFKEAVPLL